jgi:2-dehydropantoate 2-reductase
VEKSFRASFDVEVEKGRIEGRWMAMKFAIVGAGVMGTLIGSFLVKAGAEVWLINRNEDITNAIQKNGLKVIVNEEEETIPIHSVKTPQEINQTMDVVIFLVKGCHTKEAAKSAKAIINQQTYIMTLQNGIGNVEILSQFFRKDRILYGILEFAGKMMKPGVVKAFISENSKICFGPVTKKVDKEMIAIAAYFERSPVKSFLLEDVEKEVWIKLRNNSTNILFGLLRLTMGQALSQEGTEQLMQLVRNEVIEVAKAKGIDFSEKDLSVNKGKTPINPELYGHLPSTAQDMKNKRETEVEFINGAVYREGLEVGIATPHNEMLYKMIKVIESTYHLQYS